MPLRGNGSANTLETLLATRLPDPAIFLGKVAAPVVWVAGAALLATLGGWVTAWAVAGARVAQAFPPVLVWAMPLTGLLAAALGAGITALVSYRAANVRNAAQYVTYGVFGAAMVIQVAGSNLPVSIRHPLWAWILSLHWTGALLLGGSVLLVADVALLALGLLSFRRSRLFPNG